MSIDKLEPFLGDEYLYYVYRQVRAVFRWSVPIKTRFEIFKYLIKGKKSLFMDDRMIICDKHIWTEIDLESYVRNYYVHRQVRAIFRWMHTNPDLIWNFQIFN